MQSIPDARQQSFEELYGPPENFLEIEVCATPRTTQPRRPLPHSLSVHVHAYSLAREMAC